MKKIGIVTGFFQSIDAAASVLEELAHKGYKRSAAIYHDVNGRTRVVGPMRHVGARIPKSIVTQFEKLIVEEENLVIVLAAASDLPGILQTMQQASSALPAVFAFPPRDIVYIHPKALYDNPPLSVESLHLAASKLAHTLRSGQPSSVKRRPLLQRLSVSERSLKFVESYLTGAVARGQSLSMSAEWILDNSYTIQKHVDDFRANLPVRYYQYLPVVMEGSHVGLPRVYSIASELIEDTDALLDQERIYNFLEAYQGVTPLTIGELWALPLMLRLCMIENMQALALETERRERERELADFWANRLLTAARRTPEKLSDFLKELALQQPEPSSYLADQLISYLYDEEVALTPVRIWLEEKLKSSLAEVIQQEQNHQTAEQTAISNIITNLQQFSYLEWRDLFERLSHAEAILRTDPSGVYPRMDFATRDYYRHAVEEISRSSKVSETEAARQAVELSNAGEFDPAHHVGYFLIDAGRKVLEEQLGCRPKLAVSARRFVRSHSAALYLGSIAIITLFILFLFLTGLHHAGTDAFPLILIGLLALIPASEAAIHVINFLVTRFMPPQFIPRMSFKDGIPDTCHTLVIIPMMLLTTESIRDEVEHLEVRYLANPDSNLFFGLLSDFSDAPQKEMLDDVERLDVAVHGIEELNKRYGEGKFFLFHRERKWSASEEGWIGWERKRGKLDELNSYLVGEAGQDNLLWSGDASLLQDIRFVITLDSDTQLPRDTARHLVETLAHPLNRPHLSADGRNVARGYTIIQPGVSTSLPSATATRFSLIFTDPPIMDPYTHTISDVYQDLADAGSYYGKGIYDLHVFHKVISDRFPEAHLLSHDLLEGVHVRVGIAGGIELLDLFPGSYAAYAKRRHRWTRGDWQIADWLLPHVPNAEGGKTGNPLLLFSRWKIADNLRRSLIPIALSALLLAGWFLSPAGKEVSLFAGIVLLMTPFLIMIELISRHKARAQAVRELYMSLIRAVILTAMLPDHAGSTLDAIVRVFYRRMVSHRRLLEWETAQAAHKNFANSKLSSQLQSVRAPIGFAVAAIVCWLLTPIWATGALPFLALWIAAPLLVLWLDAPLKTQDAPSLSGADQRMLRQIARQTWRFFSEFTGEQTNWLPPDNYQASLRVEAARRTSPTNIGLGLLASLAAFDMGYVNIEEVIGRTLATMKTLDKMERYEGHLLNWHDTQTLLPLLPKYVSMVDSGNLLGDLWTLEQGLNEIFSGPILKHAAFNGIQDCSGLIRQTYGPQEKTIAPMQKHLALLEQIVQTHVLGLEGMVQQIRVLNKPAVELASAAGKLPEDDPQRYWANQTLTQVAGWNGTVDTYLAWVEILASPPDQGLLMLGTEAHEWRRQGLAAAPSMRTLAAGGVTGLRDFVALQLRSDDMGLPTSLCHWLEMLSAAAMNAQIAAAERLTELEEALSRIRTLAEGMNMRFLYDEERRNFYTGYNLSEKRMDPGHYDLLASEARLGSFLAIARGEVPVEHWWALGRPYSRVSGRRALLSWNGSMFEYLMPLLLMRRFENSMLDEACRAAVGSQISYGKQRNLPWGISEAAFSALDANQVYQYRSFGAPGLGIKRGLEDDLVIAPYATALALEVDPAAAVKNMRRLCLDNMPKMIGDYGCYESIDYTRRDGPEGKRGVIVYTYMAHHQGMILASIDNALNNNIMQARFHWDPRVKATQSLLYERPPSNPVLLKDSRQQEPALELHSLPSDPASSLITTALTSIPRTNLLSNGHYTVLVTNSGGGYSSLDGKEIVRWSADTTRDACGSFFYVRDRETNYIWSVGYQPVHAAPQQYTVAFNADRAEFRRRDRGIETVMEVVVSPEDNVEVRLITLINHSLRRREMEITSYQEVALAPHKADRAHPAFSKMFVETEALPGQGALLAHRRPRSTEEASLWAMHVTAEEGLTEDALQCETDRALFLGRRRGADRPEAMERELSGKVGTTLDPIFSLRRRVFLEAGARVQIAFVTGASETRDEASSLAEKYSDMRAARRAMAMAWTYAQLELRHLRIHQEEASLFQQLAAHLLYPNALLRASLAILARNSLGQSRLWPYGISGDIPLLAISIEDIQDIELVKQVLIAHLYLQTRGLNFDLVVLNEEAVRYEQPLQIQLNRLMEAHAYYTGKERQGRAFLFPAGQIPAEDRILLLTAARVAFVAARGPLSRQHGFYQQPSALPQELVKNTRIKEEPSPPLPFMELAYFNGLGGFTADGREYVIYLGPGSKTPLPWVNIMSNPTFGTMVSESGAGFTWYGNSQSARLTPWSNDPVSDPAGDAIYIRDEEMGVFWTPTAGPIREQDAYRIRHGQGFTLFEHNSHAIEQLLTTFVPMDVNGGDPLRIQRLRLCNRSSRRRRLSIIFYCEWTLGTDREETQMHVSTEWEAQGGALLARNPYHPDYGGRVAFVASNMPCTSYSGDRTAFLGRNGSVSAPAALTCERLSGRIGAGLDPCAALQVMVEIEPQQNVDVVFLLGQAADAEEARTLTEKYRNLQNVEEALQTTRNWWENLLGVIHVETPDEGVNFLLNRWLLYQDVSCRLFGRSAFYQSGGAYGFRDQLQDVMALVYAAPQIARAQIVRTAARQFPEGDVQHWWHLPSGAGVRTRITDDLLWLPFVAAQYVRVTGDDGILDELIPFLDGKELTEGQQEAYTVPTVSLEQATALEHCRRAILKGFSLGRHGLPLIGGGDWNDGMNRVGIEGRGESVWLGWFLIHVLNDFAELLLLRSGESEAAIWRERAEKLAEAIEKEAWDGKWYLRAFYDDGTPLGSADSEEARIDSIAQSWAVISGAAMPERAKMAMDAVEEHLVRAEEKMILLFTPPFDKSLSDPGYIKGYPPGVRENGGQYTHGSLWTPMAFARMGDGDRATELLRMMNPVEHSRTLEEAMRFKVEPYVAVADIYALEGQVGRGGWSWYTGSAGWMYRVWLEEVLGFKLRKDRLTIDPCISASWEGFTLRYRYHSARYEVRIENPNHVCKGVSRMELDGEPAEKTIVLQDDNAEHLLIVAMA